MKRLITILGLCAMITQLFASGIGYALSGGGARGFAHIGILKVLEEEGIYPDYISGTSIGAVIGALSALGYSAEEIEELAVSINWQDLFEDKMERKELYIGQKRWAPYGNVVLELNDEWIPQLPSAIFKVNSINLQLFELVAAASVEQNFMDYPVPFSCVATDLVTGEGKIFKQGSLLQALRSSISIPSILPPFRIGDNYYIDGGISQNLPIDEVRDMGADVVAGIKVNSSLRTADQLNSFVHILDQTINIGITRNMNEGLDGSDFLLEPDLMQYSSTDFRHAREIIAIGEDYARQNIDTIRSFFAEYPSSFGRKAVDLDPRREDYHISQIIVHGNTRLSSAKICEYLGLQSDQIYSPREISQGCKAAWNSQFFDVIYPDLTPHEDGKYILNIYVTETQPKTLAINNSYSDEEKLSASVILGLENLLLKNSKLLVGLILGGRNELNIDYVKNFGDFWGVYYRVFPYIGEKTLYGYNEDHHQTNSVKSLEWGATSGVGVFTEQYAIAEFFLYYNNTRQYRGISESEMPPQRYEVGGFGLKGYHESLDDYVFPYSGMRVMGKLNFARSEEFSDYMYNMFKGEMDAYLPIGETISIHAGAKLGTYFDSAPQDKFDPFAIGGIDGFKGCSRFEVSAPHYLIMGLGLNAKPLKNLHIQAGVQALSYNDDETWLQDIEKEYCYYIGFGYDNRFAPLRLQFALNERSRVNTMLSLGYDFDVFEFSRK